MQPLTEVLLRRSLLSMATKFTINLLQAELRPEKPFLTLPKVVGTWAILLGLAVSGSWYVNEQNRQLQQQLSQLNAASSQQQQTLKQLQAELETHKPDVKLTEELTKLQTLIQHKKSIYAYLTNTEHTYIGGYARAMSELANIHSNDISIETISLSENQMTFKGLAKSAESVPNWLTNFEKSPALSNKLFTHFELSESEQSDFIQFTVSTNAVEESD